MPAWQPYVALTPVDGDAGLSEACRIWWLLESVTTTPTGSMVMVGGGEPQDGPSFSGSYPNVSLGDPLSRVSNSYGGGITNTVRNDGYPYFSPIVAFVGGAWVLACGFYYEVQGAPELGDGSRALVLSYPYVLADYVDFEDDTYTEYSGSYSLFGYTMPWYALAISYFGTSTTLEGAGFSATSTFYTLV